MLPLTAYARDCVGASGVSPCSTCQARQFSVCASLTEDGLKRLAASARTYHFAAGRTLVEQGEPAADLFNLTAGAARISRDLPDGRRQIVGFLYAGDLVGASAASHHGFTVEAIEDVTACRFGAADYERLRLELPNLQNALFERLKLQFEDAQEQMVTLGRRNALERVAAFLTALAARLGVQDEAQPTLPLPMSRTDIADYLGLTIETVSRAFTRLKSDGLIDPAARSVVLLKPDALMALAERDGPVQPLRFT